MNATESATPPGLCAAALVAVCAAALATASVSAVAQSAAVQNAKREMPVRVGMDHPDLDACGAWAEVRGLKPDGDGFLAVRSGPGAGFALRDRLREGDTFFLCAESADGQWVSIVYPRKGQGASACGVSSPVPRPTAYRGPCAYGWVHVRWVNVLAG